LWLRGKDSIRREIFSARESSAESDPVAQTQRLTQGHAESEREFEILLGRVSLRS